jgi:hypothetical protein
MKHSLWILSTLFAVTAPAVAADKLSLQWGQLAPQVEGRQLTVTTTDRINTYARCLRVEGDSLVLESPSSADRLLKLARQKVAWIHVDGREGHNMKHLKKDTGSALRWLSGAVFTPYAPVGLAGTPVVAAYFVAVTPFCVIGDLLARGEPSLDIEIVN